MRQMIVDENNFKDGINRGARKEKALSTVFFTVGRIYGIRSRRN